MLGPRDHEPRNPRLIYQCSVRNNIEDPYRQAVYGKKKEREEESKKKEARRQVADDAFTKAYASTVVGVFQEALPC